MLDKATDVCLGKGSSRVSFDTVGEHNENITEQGNSDLARS
jgi:hypothetical protein